MDTLTDLEYILCKRRINDENLPRSRHESTPKQSCDDEYDTDVEHYQVGRVARKETWQYFLLEQNEAKAATTYENLVLKQINLILGCGVRAEHLIQGPIVIHLLLSRLITRERERVVSDHGRISRGQFSHF